MAWGIRFCRTFLHVERVKKPTAMQESHLLPFENRTRSHCLRYWRGVKLASEIPVPHLQHCTCTATDITSHYRVHSEGWDVLYNIHFTSMFYTTLITCKAGYITCYTTCYHIDYTIITHKHVIGLNNLWYKTYQCNRLYRILMYIVLWRLYHHDQLVCNITPVLYNMLHNQPGPEAT